MQLLQDPLHAAHERIDSCTVEKNFSGHFLMQLTSLIKNLLFGHPATKLVEILMHSFSSKSHR